MLRRRGVRGQGHRQAARPPPLVPFVSISNLDPGFFLKEYSTPNAKICEGSDEKDQVNCAFQAFESMFGMRLMRATSIIPSFKKMMPRSSPVLMDSSRCLATQRQMSAASLRQAYWNFKNDQMDLQLHSASWIICNRIQLFDPCHRQRRQQCCHWHLASGDYGFYSIQGRSVPVHSNVQAAHIGGTQPRNP